MESTKYTPIWNGLWSQKHHKKLGPAWVLFGFLLSKTNKGGLVRITYKDIALKTGVPERTLQFWMAILKRENYVTVKKADCMVIEIHKFRSLKTAKVCGKKPQDVAGPENEIPQSIAGPSRKGLRHQPQDVAASKPTNCQKQKGSSNPLNIINKSNKYNRSTSKKSNDFEGGKKGGKHRRFIFIQADKETAIYILGKIQNIQPGFKEPNLKSWANDIRLIRESDGRTQNEIRTLFSWANDHHFWKANILSPTKLRKQWDTLTIQKNSNGNGNGYRSQAEINSASSGQVVI